MFFLFLSCAKNEDPVGEKPVPQEKKAELKIPDKAAEKAVEKEEKEETVDISNELNKLRKVPGEDDEKNSGRSGATCLAYRDADGDKFGDASNEIEYPCGTELKIGYTQKKGDCNDRNRYLNPGAVETCNGDDDNCDGIIDPQDSEGCNRYYKDMDGDGVGVAEFKCLCVSKGIYAALELGDCDDHNKNVHQNAREICNEVDDNCNGQVDEGENLKECRPFYFDKDGDGFGYQKTSKCLCKPNGLYRAEILGDCNDDNYNVNPGAAEIFDRRDNNCNGAIDENVGIKPKKYRKNKHHRNKKHHGRRKVKPPKKSEKNATHDKKRPKKQHISEVRKSNQIRTHNKKKTSRTQYVRPPKKSKKIVKDEEKRKKKKKKGKKSSAVIF